MKNVDLWTRDTDRAILAGLGALGIWVVAAVIGGWILSSVHDDLLWIAATIAGALFVFVWGGYNIVRPTRYSSSWKNAQYIAIPIMWGLLLAALTTCFQHMYVAPPEFQWMRHSFTH